MEEFNQYIADVVSGKIRTGIHTKMAIRRHISDMKRTDIYFDADDAQYAMDFFHLLNLNTDPDDFVPFILSPFQKFIVGSIFGWKKLSGNRRFNRAYIEIARKNGKTFFAAGISLYMMLADGEKSPQIFTGANSKSQAYICFEDAVKMVKASPALKEVLRIRQFDMKSISPKINAEYRYLSADATKHDGLRPHCAILDEIHEYKDGSLHNIFASGMVNRIQPLILMITTAGFNKTLWCYREQRRFATDILERKIEADNVFAIIYSLDKGDDWRDPANWIKANPNLGISLHYEGLAQEIRTAIIKPSDRVAVLTKNLNIWEDSDTTWIEREKWQSAHEKIKETILLKSNAYIGVDLSYILDITAYTIAFALPNGNIHLKHRFFVPKDSANKRQESTGIPYADWIRAGYLIPCEGETIDYELVYRYMLADFKKYKVVTAGFDFYNAKQVIDRLNNTLPSLYVREKQDKNYKLIKPCYGMSQTGRTFDPAISDLTRRLYDSPQTITHDGNPVMEWMLGNAVLITDDHELKKVSKKRSKEKVDGVISSLLAIEQLNYWSDRVVVVANEYNAGRGLKTV